MKRIYYLSQTASLASEVSYSINQAGIILKNFCVVSKDKKALKEYQLRSANIFQRRDVAHCLELGMLGGLLTGLTLALLMVVIPPSGLEVTPFLFMSVVFFIGSFGLAAGYIVGISKDNFSIAEFRDQLDRNEFILMVDVDEKQYEKVNRVMSTRFAEVIKLKEEVDGRLWVPENIDRAA